MSDSTVQSASNHRRLVPLYHFVVLPLLLANLIVSTVSALRGPSLGSLFQVAVAAAILLGLFYARAFAAGNQDRIIRLEERLRLQALLPDDQKALIELLSTGQLVGLRFASDTELPALVKRTLEAGLSGEAIKREIREWRADNQRI